MKKEYIKYIPLIIGLVVGLILFISIGWWGFLILFPWIGFSISVGIYLRQILPQRKKTLGRRICILLIVPALLIFVPLVNRENFQLEGVMLIVLAGCFSKGFIHYAVAKLFGPLIWGRGFCGWACWTAAVLDWLPVSKKGAISPSLWNLRYLALIVSIALPLYLVLVLSYDVQGDYIGKAELGWMIGGNLVYYLIAVPLAYWFKDRRAFCKVVCPVSLVMKVPSKYARIRIKPSENKCERSGLVLLPMLAGLLVLIFVLGEFLVPH
jgi:polyferredoxin